MPSGSDYDHPLWIYLGLGLRLLMTKLPKSKKKTMFYGCSSIPIVKWVTVCCSYMGLLRLSPAGGWGEFVIC